MGYTVFEKQNKEQNKEDFMKKLSKKVIAFALAVVMILTAGAVVPQGSVEV